MSGIRVSDGEWKGSMTDLPYGTFERKLRGEFDNKMSKYEVEYTTNNSGGYWWLDDNDWKNLEAAGWTIDWFANREKHYPGEYEGGRFLGALAHGATKVFEANTEYGAEAMAIAEFEDITGAIASDGGCSCCGQPHYFSTNKIGD